MLTPAALAQVMAVAKDQNGCRFLQRKFDEGGAAAIQAVLPEVLEHLIELMMDPFGNYLIQKLLDRCSEEQRLAVRTGNMTPFHFAWPALAPYLSSWPKRIWLYKLRHILDTLRQWGLSYVEVCMWCLDGALGWCQVLKKAAEKKELVQVALNTHGTRAVQKLIETLTTREQVRPGNMRTTFQQRCRTSFSVQAAAQPCVLHGCLCWLQAPVHERCSCRRTIRA